MKRSSLFSAPTCAAAGNHDDRRKKVRIPVAATLLCARELMKPNRAKFAAIENAISQTKFMLDRISEVLTLRRQGCPAGLLSHLGL